MRFLIGMALTLIGAPASADTVLYAVHVGVNQAPPRARLKPLRYADDDAARFYEFVRPLARQARLLTVMDADTQSRYRSLLPQLTAPTTAELEKVLGELATEMVADKAAGHSVTMYFSYSGHGVPQGSSTRLTVLDGYLDRAWLRTHLLSLPADALHLFIDACHAGGLLSSRGKFARERGTRARRLSSQEHHLAFKASLLERYPHVGALLATSADVVAMEWSQLEAGVFTHELLSALSGAADVNSDGQIAYSEVASFMAAANHAVADKRAVPEVVVVAPRLDHNLPILSFTWLHEPVLLEGVATAPTRLHVESARGTRILDVNADAGVRLRLLIPATGGFWIRTANLEARVEAKPGRTVRFGDLVFASAAKANERGASRALAEGLFQTPFGPDYYRGWTTTQALAPVSLDAVAGGAGSVTHWPRTLAAWLCAGGAGVTALATGFLTYQAVVQKEAFDNTEIQRRAYEARDQFYGYAAGVLATTVLTAGLVVAAVLLWPDDNWSLHLQPEVGAGSLSFNW